MGVGQEHVLSGSKIPRKAGGGGERGQDSEPVAMTAAHACALAVCSPVSPAGGLRLWGL